MLWILLATFSSIQIVAFAHPLSPAGRTLLSEHDASPFIGPKATRRDSSSVTARSSDGSTTSSHTGLSPGAIAGIVIGIAIVLIVLALIIRLRVERRRRPAESYVTEALKRTSQRMSQAASRRPSALTSNRTSKIGGRHYSQLPDGPVDRKQRTLSSRTSTGRDRKSRVDDALIIDARTAARYVSNGGDVEMTSLSSQHHSQRSEGRTEAEQSTVDADEDDKKDTDYRSEKPNTDYSVSERDFANQRSREIRRKVASQKLHDEFSQTAMMSGAITRGPSVKFDARSSAALPPSQTPNQKSNVNQGPIAKILGRRKAGQTVKQAETKLIRSNTNRSKTTHRTRDTPRPSNVSGDDLKKPLPPIPSKPKVTSGTLQERHRRPPQRLTILEKDLARLRKLATDLKELEALFPSSSDDRSFESKRKSYIRRRAIKKGREDRKARDRVESQVHTTMTSPTQTSSHSLAETPRVSRWVRKGPPMNSWHTWQENFERYSAASPESTNSEAVSYGTILIRTRGESLREFISRYSEELDSDIGQSRRETRQLSAHLLMPPPVPQASRAIDIDQSSAISQTLPPTSSDANEHADTDEVSPPSTLRHNRFRALSEGRNPYIYITPLTSLPTEQSMTTQHSQAYYLQKPMPPIPALPQQIVLQSQRQPITHTIASVPLESDHQIVSQSQAKSVLPAMPSTQPQSDRQIISKSQTHPIASTVASLPSQSGQQSMLQSQRLPLTPGVASFPSQHILSQSDQQMLEQFQEAQRSHKMPMQLEPITPPPSRQSTKSEKIISPALQTSAARSGPLTNGTKTFGSRGTPVVRHHSGSFGTLQPINERGKMIAEIDDQADCGASAAANDDAERSTLASLATDMTEQPIWTAEARRVGGARVDADRPHENLGRLKVHQVEIRREDSFGKKKANHKRHARDLSLESKEGEAVWQAMNNAVLLPCNEVPVTFENARSFGDTVNGAQWI